MSPKRRLMIAIDWDHTLMNGKVWLPGAQEALRRFKEDGHVIIIHSCNSPEWIKDNLRACNIEVDLVWDEKGKPVADIYIDDRGYKFPTNGSWDDEFAKVMTSLTEELEEFN